MDDNNAYIISMAIGGLIEAMGMMSENMIRVSLDQTPAYDHQAFYELMEERGLHHNAILTAQRG
jgi:hypothetical protein